MGRADDGEVAPVQGRDLRYPQAFGRRDNGGIDRAQGKVAIPGDELGNPQPVLGSDRVDGESSGCEVAEEPDLGLRTEAGRKEVDHLGDDERWNDERSRMGLKQIE